MYSTKVCKESGVAKKPSRDHYGSIPRSTNTGAMARPNIAGPSKKPSNKSTLQELCKYEMEGIIKLPNKIQPKSANCIEKTNKFNFNIFETKDKDVKSIGNKLINDIQKIKQDKENKENKPKRVVQLEKHCENRRSYRRRFLSEVTESQANKMGPLTGAIGFRSSKVGSTSHSKSFKHQIENIENLPNKLRTHIDENRETISYGSTNAVSPIKPNPSTSETELIRGSFNLPKINPRDSSKKSSNDCHFYHDDEDILKDILQVARIQEKQILLPQNFLLTFNPDERFRNLIVSWILSIQPLLHLDDSEVYIAVSLLDQVLARKAVPINMYQLAAMTCIIITSKYIGHYDRKMSVSLRTMVSAYTEDQMMQMEKKILKLLNFTIHSIEPTVYVNAYLKLENLDTTSGKNFEIFFCLDNALHSSSYSATPTSLVATAAISVACKMLHNPNLKKLMEDLTAELTAEEATSCGKMQLEIIAEIKKMHRSCVMKYKKEILEMKFPEDQ